MKMINKMKYQGSSYHGIEKIEFYSTKHNTLHLYILAHSNTNGIFYVNLYFDLL